MGGGTFGGFGRGWLRRSGLRRCLLRFLWGVSGMGLRSSAYRMCEDSPTQLPRCIDQLLMDGH